MNRIPKKSIIFIDYENVHNIDLSSLDGQNVRVKIFVGHKQDKIPFELVRSTHKMGRSVEWIKVDGNGTNSLDFYIAFYLGKISARVKDIPFFILSKDKGFDPLIAHLNKNKISCQRIETLGESLVIEETSANGSIDNNSSVDKKIYIDAIAELAILDKLLKLKQTARPRTKTTLANYIKSCLNPQKPEDLQIEATIDKWLIEGKISLAGKKFIYSL